METTITTLEYKDANGDGLPDYLDSTL